MLAVQALGCGGEGVDAVHVTPANGTPADQPVGASSGGSRKRPSCSLFFQNCANKGDRLADEARYRDKSLETIRQR